MSKYDSGADGFLYEDDLQDEYADVDGIDEGSLPEDMAAVQSHSIRRQRGERAESQGHRKQIRVRPMSPDQMNKYPDTKSIIITKTDGRQLCLVRKE